MKHKEYEYDGSWEDDKKKKGVMKLNNGTKYEGTFDRNKAHGQGIKWIPDKKKVNITKYSGIWKNGAMVSGRIDYPDGKYYEGTTCNEIPLRNGKGKTYYSDGRIYLNATFRLDVPLVG